MVTPGLTYEEYCELPGFNSSLLKVAKNLSLQHAQAYLRGEMVKESDALDFGHSFHEMLLRGKREFVIRPDTYPAPADHADVKAKKIKAGAPLKWNMGAKVCKEWVKQNAAGKQVHSQEEVSHMLGMERAVREHPELAPYLNDQTAYELAVTGERGGIQFKALVDILPADKSAPIIDLKKCTSAQPRAFVSAAAKFGYWIQAALNMDLLNWNGEDRREFWFVAIEDTPPHAIWICKLVDEPIRFLRVGRRDYRAAANRLTTALKTGEWPGYQDAEPEAVAPPYMIAELELTAA